MNMPSNIQRNRVNDGKTNKKLELREKHKQNDEQKEDDGEDNFHQFTWSPNDLGKKCKDLLSHSARSDHDEMLLRM